jgi:RimJ/RimL family protein N-acetyltransferase
MIECRRLIDVEKHNFIDLMNHPQVRKHMPLASGAFDDAAYDAFIVAKEALWKNHGYGPWAFLLDGKFVGWGGLQYEEGEADIALVLHPNHWGLGKAIFDLIITEAFGHMRLESVTALLPPSRKRLKVMSRLGFKPDGEICLQGQRFLRFRLCNNKKIMP